MVYCPGTWKICKTLQSLGKDMGIEVFKYQEIFLLLSFGISNAFTAKGTKDFQSTTILDPEIFSKTQF